MKKGKKCLLIFCLLFSFYKIISLISSNKFIIHIAYSADNKYAIPALVSMSSLLETIKLNNTFYDIYILVSKNFTKANKIMLKSVQLHYPKNCRINMINMYDLFLEQKTSVPSTYYRLALQDKLPYIDKIIYLDGDTMIFDDLTELFKLNMRGYYILGFLDSFTSSLNKYGIKEGAVLNAGVLLMDLKALRNFNAMEKYKEFLKSQNNSVFQSDQTVINYVLQGHLYTLPPKYGMWGFTQYEHAVSHNNVQRSWLRYNESELKEAFEHPAILHYTAGKPFRDKEAPFSEIWWRYANKTGYYEDIFKYFSNHL